MPATKRWTVDVCIDEDEQGHTYAEARLQSGADTRLTGVGRARLDPADADVPEIGDELAVARALTNLGYRLLVTATGHLHATARERVAVRE